MRTLLPQISKVDFFPTSRTFHSRYICRIFFFWERWRLTTSYHRWLGISSLRDLTSDTGGWGSHNRRQKIPVIWTNRRLTYNILVRNIDSFYCTHRAEFSRLVNQRCTRWLWVCDVYCLPETLKFTFCNVTFIARNISLVRITWLLLTFRTKSIKFNPFSTETVFSRCIRRSVEVLLSVCASWI